MGDLPYSLEQDLFDRKNQALGYIQQGATSDPYTVSRLIGITSTWNDIQPGVSVALAKNGFDQYSPETKQVAQLATKQKLSTQQWRQHLSQVKTAADFDKEFGHLTPAEYKALSPRDQHALLTHAIKLGYDKTTSPGISGALSDVVAHSPLGQTAAPVQETPVIGPTLGSAAKSISRTTALAANTPLQAVQGFIRNAAYGVNELAQGNVDKALSPPPVDVVAQTQAGQAGAALLAGEKVDIGSGYLPDPNSPTGQAAAEAARAAAPTIGGHAFTLGRYTASQVFEPDTEPFNVLSGVVDAGVAIKTDPTALALSHYGDQRAAARLFNPDAGLVETTGRNFVNQETKANYLLGDQFVNGAGKIIAEDPSPASIWRKTGIPVTDIHGRPVLSDLADTRSVDNVRAIIDRTTQLTGPLDTPGFTYKLKQAIDSRLFASMPYGSIADASDKNVNIKILDDIMRAGNVPQATRDAALDAYIRDPSPIAGLKAVSDTVTEHLVNRYGVPEAKARALANFWPNAKNHLSAYDIDQSTGVERIRPGIGIEGQGHVVPAPSLSSEQLNSPISIPDLRAMRRWATDFNHITGTKPWEVTQTALSIPAAIWKPLQVLTARMMVRITGETQLNLLTRGMDNMFTHPLRTISAMMGSRYDKSWETLAEKVPGLDAAYILGPDGKAAIDESTDLLMHSAAFIHDPETIATRNYIAVPISHPDAHIGFAEQLGKMSSDPIMQGIARADTPEAAKEWFWSGGGKGLRVNRAPIVENQDAYGMQKVATGEWSGYTPLGDIRSDRAAADAYIDQVMYPRLRDFATTDELVDAVRTGKLGGADIYNRPAKNWDLATIDKRASDRARELLDAGEGPQRSVPIRQNVSVASSTGSKGAALANAAIDHIFHALVDVPDRLVNRSPAYVQRLWNYRVPELLPYADDATRAAVLSAAERSNLPDALLTKLHALPVDTSGSTRLNLDQLTKLAKANALDDIKNIVHDLTTRSQFFDMTRMLFPFGDAFRLIAKRWVNTLAEEPQAIRRLQQGIEAARAPGSAAVSALFGDPVPHGQGFFHKDANGEEVFSMPGSTWLDKTLLGVPIPLSGQVKGLSLIGEGYPGLGGPTLTIPAKWFLPNTPMGDQVKSVIFPYGGGESAGIGADIGEAFIPSWLSKVANGPIDQRAYNNTVNMMLQTLASSGDYQLTGPNAQAETQRMLQDAKDNARWIYVIRGAAQFVSPSSPTPTGMVEDKTGRLAITQVIANKYHEQITKHGPEAAFDWLISRYGTKNIFVAQKASQATSYAAPVTKEAQAWVDSHPGITDKFPLTYGLFAPTKGSFDVTTYGEQFAKGERRSLSGAEQIAQAENRLGFYVYDRAQQVLVAKNGGGPLTSNQQTLLTQLKGALAHEYPGFNSYTADPFDTAKRRTSAIAELTQAVDDPTISKTDAGQGLAGYLVLRDATITKAQSSGYASPFQAKSLRNLRDVLRAAADHIITQHPDFRPLWDQVFSRELAKDT